MKKFLRGFKYAALGIAHCARYERNFRVHAAVAAAVVGVGARYGLNAEQWAILALTIALVLTAEAVNTAVERAADAVGGAFSPVVKAAKDAAAGAALISALGAVCVGLALFSDWERLKDALFGIAAEREGIAGALIFVAAAAAAVGLPVSKGRGTRRVKEEKYERKF